MPDPTEPAAALQALAEAARRLDRGDLATPVAAGVAEGGLAALRDALEALRQGLAAREAARAVRLAAVAHEVRNPLGGLTLLATALLAETAGTPAARLAERVQAEVATLARVAEELLDDARARPPSRAPVALDALLAEVAGLVRPLADARGVEVRASGAGEALGDRDRLRRAVLNLARNAVEASEDNGVVELRARREGGGAVIEALDRGPGLTAAARAQLFRPFFTTKGQGTGLGLALAREVAEAHGGALALEDRAGGGTVARLTVPG